MAMFMSVRGPVSIFRLITSFLIAVIVISCWLRTQTAVAADAGDLLIKNGLIIDGSIQDPYRADLLIRDGRIAAIEANIQLDLPEDQTIDATGRVVTPGFIDAHTHGDPVNKDQSFENFLAMGVATVVLGQDGANPGNSTIDKITDAPTLDQWLDEIRQNGAAVNVVPLAGHGALRGEVGLLDDRIPSKSEQRKLERLLDRALEQGLFGLSLGLEYFPGIYAQPAELEGLAKIVGNYDGIIMSHMRSEDYDKIEQSIEELLALGQYADVHVSHIKVVLGTEVSQARDILGMLSTARANGMRASADVYPYMAGHTSIALLFPAWSKSRSDFERAKAERRSELEDYLYKRVMKRKGPSTVLFSTAPYLGKTLEEVAAESNKPFVDLLIDDIGVDGAKAAYFVMDEKLQEAFILSRDVMIGTDGSPVSNHPRSVGTYARIIQKYVVDEGKLDLTTAIYKMSGLPAETLGLKDRGRIKVGYHADINVFSPENVRELASWTNPTVYSTGFDVVIVNGQIVRKNEELVTANAGELILRSTN